MGLTLTQGRGRASRLFPSDKGLYGLIGASLALEAGPYCSAIAYQACGPLGSSQGPPFPSLRTLRAIPSLSCQALVTLMSSVQARLTQALPTPRDSSPWLLLGPDWFDLVRQPVVSQSLFSGDLEAHSTWLRGELRSCLGPEH